MGKVETENTTAVPRLLRIKEVARITTLPTWRVYDLIREGLPHIRVGNTFRVPEDQLVAWIAQRSEARR